MYIYIYVYIYIYIYIYIYVCMHVCMYMQANSAHVKRMLNLRSWMNRQDINSER